MTSLRIVIAGGPHVGKTTLAEKLSAKVGAPIKHCDDLIATHEWSEASGAIASWLGAPGPWIIEGVAVVRGLRKWLAAHPLGAPADVVYLGTVPKVALTSEQLAMLRGCTTIWSQIQNDVVARGVTVTLF